MPNLVFHNFFKSTPRGFRGVPMPIEPSPCQVKAGRIAARVLREACQLVKPGVKVVTICARSERRIIELGGRPAFPCNVSTNEVAAHYTSPRGDESVIPDFGLVKIDVGVHVDGYIADTARTVDIDGTLNGFVEATDDALNEAIATMKPGVSVDEVGGVIERTIRAYGLNPVRELTGHSLGRFVLHGGKQIPNYPAGSSTRIEAGEVYAIEPFATSGRQVGDSKYVYIFSNTKREPHLEGTTERLYQYLKKKYGYLPFASRWIGTTQSGIDLIGEIRKLMKLGAIRGYPVLVEKSNRPVSQSEHTVFVTEDRCQILTQEG